MIEQDIDSDKRTDIFSIFPQAGNTAALRQIVKEMTERGWLLNSH